MVFYLVLRGLDTIEDDMSLQPLSYKCKLLEEFWDKLSVRGWSFHESGPNEKDRIVLTDFHYIIDEFLLLDARYLVSHI